MYRSLTFCLLLTHLSAHAFDVYVGGGPAHCGNNNGYAFATPWGGTPPYTYNWSNGAATDTITGLVPDTYSVVVTDGLGEEAMGFYVVMNYDNPSYNAGGTQVGVSSCDGQCTSGVGVGPEILAPNMVPPFMFSPSLVDLGNPSLLGYLLGYCPEEPMNLTVTDALGCTVQFSFGVAYASDPTPMSIVDVQGSCQGMNYGSVTVNVGLDAYGVYPSMWQCRILNAAMQLVPNGTLFFTYPGPNNNIATKGNLSPGGYYLERTFTNLLGNCQDLLPFTIPDLGPNCGVITGTAFVDDNESCSFNAGEVTVGQGTVAVQPGPYYTTLSSTGTYALCLPPGNYMLLQNSASVQEHCAGGPIPFTISAGSVTTKLLPDTSLVDLDLGAMVISGPARPGFAFDVAAAVYNLTPTSSGATTTTLTFDPLLTYVSASPAGGVVAGNTITWDQNQLGGWQQRSYTATFMVPPDPGLLGTDLVTTLQVASVNTDGDPANNTGTDVRTITGSYDPNDKLARTSGGNTSVWQIDEDEWIDYIIRFQNTGTDTAFNVLVTDTLPTVLDAATILWGAASHPHTRVLEGQGVVKFYFPNILLPDSNVNEPASNGFVSFRIRPHLPVLPGTAIENIANIHFDFNPPVITEPSVLVAETSTGVAVMTAGNMIVRPNPTDGPLTIHWPGGTLAGGTLRVLTTDGRLVTEQRAYGTHVDMSITHLPPGLYLVVHTAPDGSRMVTRIVRR